MHTTPVFGHLEHVGSSGIHFTCILNLMISPVKTSTLRNRSGLFNTKQCICRHIFDIGHVEKRKDAHFYTCYAIKCTYNKVFSLYRHMLFENTAGHWMSLNVRSWPASLLSHPNIPPRNEPDDLTFLSASAISCMASFSLPELSMI